MTDHPAETPPSPFEHLERRRARGPAVARKSRMKKAALLTTLLLSCATERAEPTQSAAALSPQGYLAADYDMVVKGRPIGEAVIWSNGTTRTDLQGRRTTLLHVGFTVENTTDDNLVLSPEGVKLHLKRSDRILDRTKPIRLEGVRNIPPGEKEDLELYYELPKDVPPNDVDAFRIQWRATAGDRTYAQRTPFLQNTPAPAVYRPSPTYSYRFLYSPFYDPFLHQPFHYEGNLIVHPAPFHHRHPRKLSSGQNIHIRPRRNRGR